LVTRALAEYAVLFAAPTNLHMERDVSDRAERGGNGALKTGIGTLVVIGMMGWGWWTKHHAPVATFGLTAFAAAYLPVSNLFSLNATVAEHWLYVPSAFLLIALAATAERFLHGRQRSWPFLVCVGAWAVMLGVCTRAQQGYWFNQRAFFSGTIAAGGDSARMHVNMGNLEARDGHPDLAMEHYHQALRRQPELAFALLGMASLELRRDNPAEARRLLQRAAKEPFFAPECLQLQAAVEFRESKRETTELLRRALELAPNRWPFRMRYLTALEQNGRRAEAVNELRDFLTREPFRAESWQLLGDLLANQHQPQLAIAAFERAIELDVHATEAAVRIELLRRINKLAPH
ncbi:MAG: tetratricopeptide repeat protein, partial [Verrucomicrobiota bacterium]